MFDYLDEHFRNLDKKNEEREEQFKKLYLDQCSVVPEVGDTVVVASGLLARGFNWIREEAKVLHVGSSIKVQFVGETKVHWIHPALITDVIKVESCPSPK